MFNASLKQWKLRQKSDVIQAQNRKRSSNRTRYFLFIQAMLMLKNVILINKRLLYIYAKATD